MMTNAEIGKWIDARLGAYYHRIHFTRQDLIDWLRAFAEEEKRNEQARRKSSSGS